MHARCDKATIFWHDVISRHVAALSVLYRKKTISMTCSHGFPLQPKISTCQMCGLYFSDASFPARAHDLLFISAVFLHLFDANCSSSPHGIHMKDVTLFSNTEAMLWPAAATTEWTNLPRRSAWFPIRYQGLTFAKWCTIQDSMLL